MRIVTPESWYRLFWIVWTAGVLLAGYWVIRWGVAAALRDYFGAQQ